MPPIRKSVTIVLAEDDDDDYLLTKDGFKEANLFNPMHRVKDGEELVQYLYRRGQYENQGPLSWPLLVLLDLNMPKKDGREALKEIKSHPRLRRIPVIVLTTSRAEEDLVRTYDLGANSFIRKPIGFSELVELAQTLGQYWFDLIEFPPHLY